MAHIGFDTEQYQAAQGFDPLPAGKYEALITGSEVKPTKTGGSMLVFEYTIIGPSYANRKVWSQHNVQNPSAEAERIGREQVKAIAAAVGVMRPTDSVELHGKPMTITIAIEKGKDGYPDRNVVRGWIAAEGSATPPASHPPTKPAAAKPAPWAKTKAA